MSVCNEGWKNHKRRCPVIDWVDNGICDVTKPFLAFDKVDTCAHAPALKAVVENLELVLVAVPRSWRWATVCYTKNGRIVEQDIDPRDSTFELEVEEKEERWTRGQA